MNAADVGPAAPADQTQSPFDLFVIFVGANVVATTFQVGASLAPSFSPAIATTVIAVGSVLGAALVAVLAPLGPRLRVPSIIAARAALGTRGAGLVAIVLYVSNFAWIALNNAIAASACARVAARFGIGATQTTWAVILGLLATVVVWGGPRAVAAADRVAVPLMVLVSVILTVACLRAAPAPALPAEPGMTWLRGLDVVVAYQVSWILMFADYSRYTRSRSGSAVAVFVALAATSAWLMPLGTIAARAAATSDPGAMLEAVGLGAAGALLLTLATLTTNFVNIYMSSLAWKSLVRRASDTSTIWSIGLVGVLLSAVPGVWLDQYTTFMVLLGAILVPVGGVLVAHFYVLEQRPDAVLIGELYDEHGPFGGMLLPGMLAWAAGAATFYVAGSIGGTMPALAVSAITYLAAARVSSTTGSGGTPNTIGDPPG